MNKSKLIVRAQTGIALIALFITGLLFAQGHLALGLLLVTLLGVTLNRPRGRLCLNTLSVPEILGKVFDAFKTQLFEIFGGANGFVTDFKSDTAKLGDKLTAKLSHVPVTGTYDPNNGGFENASQDVLTLIEDLPVTLNQLPIVTVKIGWLTGLATKGVPLFEAAISNIGYALVGNVLNGIFLAAQTNVSNVFQIIPGGASLDNFESLRNQCNFQKMAGAGRLLFINTPLAGALGQDDRVRSELFYGQRNGEQGIRVWKDVAGFSRIQEFPDYPGVRGGLALDRRLVCMSVRKIPDDSEIVKALNIPKVMSVIPIDDKVTGLSMRFTTYQKQNTGDVIASAAILFGLGIGNQGGAPGTMTDLAGCLIRTN